MAMGTFFTQRWQRRVGWATLFWRDMLLLGTALHALSILVMLALLSKGAATAVVLAVHLLSLPYGLFIVAALWRAPHSPAPARVVSLAWLALTVVI
ncbi:MAG: hypothetical protein C0443_07080 [Comamonadaceae bacterium]|nr:hypothetical protein [Comamonadaceae bacterium]